jgi:hypothetical protein
MCIAYTDQCLTSTASDPACLDGRSANDQLRRRPTLAYGAQLCRQVVHGFSAGTRGSARGAHSLSSAPELRAYVRECGSRSCILKISRERRTILAILVCFAVDDGNRHEIVNDEIISHAPKLSCGVLS